MTLPAVGSSSYNGVSFGSDCETLLYDITPVYDTAGRTVVYNEIRLRLKFRVHLVGNESPTVTTDTGDQYNADPSGGINYLRKKLLQPAAPLIYASKGLGTLRVNVQQQTLNLGFDLE